MIPSADFKMNDIFEINVTCSRNCEIAVEAYMNSEIDLVMGKYTQIQFHMNAAGVVINSKLPSDVNNFSEVNIIATIDNAY